MKKVIRLTESDLKRIVKRVLKEETEYIPTGVPNSEGDILILDKNSSIGILDDGKYKLINSDSVFKNYNTTKKIPNGVDYFLQMYNEIDGFNVHIYHSGYLTIKDQKLVGNDWKDLFSKFNNVSLKTPNDLLSDEDDIFQSLLDGTVPCFEIDKGKNYKIGVYYNIKTGTVNSFWLRLKSKCDDKINNVYLTLDSSNDVHSLVSPSSGSAYTTNVVWDGNDLSFPKSKSGKSELIIKVNESIRKVLRSYFL
jgi:hypothetical protein